MAPTPIVNVSGMMLSSLLYEHANSYGDQEGFFLGEVEVHETHSISDRQLSVKKEETSINIYTYVPCDTAYSFYACNGDILDDRLQSFLKGRQKDVVGWYRFRRHSARVPSLREMDVHKKLTRALSIQNNFVIGIFVSSCSANFATHTFDHRFCQIETNSMGTSMLASPVNVKVVNLENTNHNEYRSHSHAPVNMHYGSFCKIITLVQECDERANSVSISRDINLAILKKIEGLLDQVGGSEAEIGSMSLEIDELEQTIDIYKSLAAKKVSALQLSNVDESDDSLKEQVMESSAINPLQSSSDSDEENENDERKSTDSFQQNVAPSVNNDGQKKPQERKSVDDCLYKAPSSGNEEQIKSKDDCQPAESSSSSSEQKETKQKKSIDDSEHSFSASVNNEQKKSQETKSDDSCHPCIVNISKLPLVSNTLEMPEIKSDNSQHSVPQSVTDVQNITTETRSLYECTHSGLASHSDKTSKGKEGSQHSSSLSSSGNSDDLDTDPEPTNGRCARTRYYCCKNEKFKYGGGDHI